MEVAAPEQETSKMVRSRARGSPSRVCGKYFGTLNPYPRINKSRKHISIYFITFCLEVFESTERFFPLWGMVIFLTGILLWRGKKYSAA
jgi:hypothetical protein